jgi:hypothetical protein
MVGSSFLTWPETLGLESKSRDKIGAASSFFTTFIPPLFQPISNSLFVFISAIFDGFHPV